jgi:hypothetical protein
MVTSDENGILQDLERERRMTARQALLKRLWKLRRPKGEHAKPAKNHAVAAVSANHPNHVRAARHVTDTNVELGTGD